MNSKIHYTAKEQKENELLKNDPFTYLEIDQNNDYEEVYVKLRNKDDFDTKKLKRDISALKKKLKRYRISFRDLLTCAPKNENSIFMCIKAAKGIVENDWILEKIERHKKLPIEDVLNVANVYRGTLKKYGKYIIALCLIITSGLESLNAYINETYSKKEQNGNMGTVLELTRGGAIVMSDDCSFHLIRKRKGMALGQQVKFAKWEIKRYNDNKVKKGIAGVALLGITSLLLFYCFRQNYSVDKVYAFVYIDINPSLGLLIGKNNTVVDVNAINRDADILLMDNDLRGMPVDAAIERIFEFAHDRGFVYEDRGNLVLISLTLNPDIDEDGDEEEKFESLFNQIESEIEGDEVIVPLVIAVPQDIVKSAQENNLSIGRQYIYEKSQKFDLAEVRGSSIEDLLFESEIFTDTQ